MRLESSVKYLKINCTSSEEREERDRVDKEKHRQTERNREKQIQRKREREIINRKDQVQDGWDFLRKEKFS